MNLRDLPVYQKHLDAYEPEEHAKVSIEYAIALLNDILIEATLTDRFLLGIIAAKMKELKLLLK